ncbi:4-alpha-glucanotransferase [Propionibacterium freudenreichii]|uniref:4-alpha-glucanotransferase n=1 Tax=Propionibacterium freudenreichii TaxID=1744 RepID=A0A2C7ANN7_9ACTN|nr:4-alpha-glucanotransferase [Propionibacterium freudenreichii]ARO12776.1 4-alpha-glucanotransferase [Propionibacterium freudenreichii]CUW09413.1 4-alpha-glucanotransferase [Propionibacterium freudenreichii subsp. shermanii]SCQ81706.1 4-alpha-glucanotransferase malQ [Propionibacterium freudenreichii]SPB30598.1 4-alpha-glucanotransferase [Propionibacterium freudenreichii subsp. shermanii]SPS08712.1 4-alpha-glucanotransferase [Propionibacterium freudenreichii subsp. shermanii]
MSTHRKPGTPASPDGARGQQPDHPRFIRPAPDDPVQRAALLRRLVPLGVNGTYIDAAGREIRVPTATLELVSAAFEDSLPRGIGPALVCTPGRYHPELFGTLVPEDGGPVQAHGVVNTPGYHVLYTVRGVRRLVIATPEHLREPQRSWGWQVQLYAARSRDSWGIGDFRDLGQICRIAAQQGAQCVQVSPVHAIAPVSHPKDSPYSPASRHFLNLLHIAPGFAPGAERVNLSDLSARGRALNDERLIDRTAVWALKREALERIWQAVRDEPNIEFREFRRHRGRALTRFATWSAIAEDLDSPDWPDWPTELHNPEGVDVARYAHEHADRVNFFSWCQWVADWQYGRACTEGVDVIADLAVGFDRGSEDAWAFHGQLCFDFEIGAPPDEHNQDGQRWGLPPFSPQMEERTDFAAFRDMVARGLAHTHALRIDHVMQLWRLFWIPRDADPADGAYVHYPVHALLAILRLEAMRTNAWIVGEDMGTVAPGMRETMHGIGMLSNCSAVRTPIADFPELALGTSSTHDQVTIAGLLTGADAAELRRIGKRSDWAQIERSRRKLAEMAHIDPAKPAHRISNADIHAAVVARYRLLAQSPSRVVLASLDDAAAVRERPNVPGTIDEYPNWRLALPEPIDTLLNAPLARDVVAVMRETR